MTMHHHHIAALANIRAKEMQEQAHLARTIAAIDDRHENGPVRRRRRATTVVATIRRQLFARA
jgi:hypothetical protein